ncbi:hypothetical protein [Halovivax sp.]|nr:hypothetical protein [Halovivax sp.]
MTEVTNPNEADKAHWRQTSIIATLWTAAIVGAGTLLVLFNDVFAGLF